MSGEREERGQSLVELAIFLPILLLILVGIVEVGHALTAYLVIANAAREGARFGAAGGKDEDITTVILTSTRLDVTADRADIYVIRARLNAAGEVEKWKEAHTYGDGPETSGFTAEEIKEWPGGGGGPTGVGLLITVFDYDLKSLLGLPGLSVFSEMISLRAHAVMRVGGAPEVITPPTEGCAVFPIALPASAVENADREDILGPFENGTEEDQFGWLRWQEHQAINTAVLAAALAWPGNSQDPYKGYNGGQGVRVGDGVWGSNNPAGSKHLVTDILADYRDRGIYLRVIVWDGYEDGRYKVTGFAIVNPVAFADDLTSLSVRFSHTDESCGQR
ncbi:MAG TPA: hypothetical protein EYP49_12940 [Anaerolineae bacterium]|nr:hypothetical protein [Anaerolineae bacterium]